MHAVQCHVQGPLDEDRLNFGKHRTKHIRLVEVAYLQWILTNFPESSAWRNAAANALRQQREAEQEVPTLLADLKACSTRRDLDWGRKIHSRAVECGSDSNVKVAVGLIQMYSKCSSMVDARRVFDSTQKPDVIAWTALLLGYAENGEGSLALELFSTMKSHGCMPNSVTYVAALKACMGSEQALDIGRSIHSEVGCHLNLYVQNALIDMYAKAGSMVDAHRVFDNIQDPDVVSWTALLLGYAENGKGHITLELFSKMKTLQCEPSYITYVAVLKACTSLAMAGSSSKKARALETGRVIHLEVGHHLNRYVQSTLIDMYATCSSMVEARQVFDSIENPDVFSWTALLLGYAENGEGHVAVELFARMKAQGCAPNAVTYVAVLKACASIGSLTIGREFHEDISDFNAHLVTCLVDFYGKCGSMVEAHAVFDLHSGTRDISTWNALLTGYSTYSDTVSVFKLFEAMQDEGFQPDAVTFLCTLLCCSHAGLVQKAKEYLEAMPRYSVTPTVMHYTCMVDTLARGNRLSEAIAVLQRMPCNADPVMWTTLLCACHKWKNVGVGTWAFESLTDMDTVNASAYVLMAHIYGSRGMWEEQERVLAYRLKSKLLTLSPPALLQSEHLME